MKDYTNANDDIKRSLIQIKDMQSIDTMKAKSMEDDLILSLSYLVHSATYKYKQFNNYPDLYQEGMIGLINAVKNFNTNLTFHFTRYALWWIKARIMRSIKKMNVVNIFNNDDDKYFVQYEVNDTDIVNFTTPESILIDIEKIAQIQTCIADLSPIQKDFIKMRYGFNAEANSLCNIGEKLNMTYSKVRKLEVNILTKFKNNKLLND